MPKNQPFEQIQGLGSSNSISVHIRLYTFGSSWEAGNDSLQGLKISRSLNSIYPIVSGVHGKVVASHNPVSNGCACPQRLVFASLSVKTLLPM